MVRKYKKKPVVIEAIHFTDKTEKECYKFLENQNIEVIIDNHKVTQIKIETLEGIMTANLGDYIIKGIKGEFYPCKPDIFEANYEFEPETKGVDHE